MLLVSIFILVIGFVALIKGADWFVDGSSAMAKTLHVPGVIIGLTIVALGTSAPELAVSTLAALQGSNEIAISNVVGSNIFNMMFILGISSLIHPIDAKKASEIIEETDKLIQKIKKVKKSDLKLLRNGEGYAESCVYISDYLSVLRRITEHSQNIAESLI